MAAMAAGVAYALVEPRWTRPLAYATVRAIEPAAGQQQVFLRTVTAMNSNDNLTRVVHQFPVRQRRRLAIILIALAGIAATDAAVYGGFAKRPLATLLLAAFSAGLAGATAAADALATGRW